MQDKSDFSLAFLSILEISDLGFCGGLLLLNPLGRPIEFHCTLPYQPDRSQQIFYGATLRPFVYNELLGPSLIQKSKATPRAIFVDSPISLGLQKLSDLMVVHLDTNSVSKEHANLTVESASQSGDAHAPPQPTGEEMDSSLPSDRHGGIAILEQSVCPTEMPNLIQAEPSRPLSTSLSPGLKTLSIRDQMVSYAQEEVDEHLVREAINCLPEELCLTEPFQRIHEAIHEAHSVAR